MIYLKLLQFFILAGLLFAGDYAINLFRGDYILQFLVAGIVSLGYAVWGIVYHIIHRDLHFKVMVEYMLISLVGIMLFSIRILS